MPKSYSNDVSRPIFNMSRDRYVSFDNAKPLMKILDDEKVPVLAADYVIKTDTNVRSEMVWEDVKKLVARCRLSSESGGLRTLQNPTSQEKVQL